MSDSNLTVCIVDDDESIRNAVSLLMKTENITVYAYPGAQEFLDGMPQSLIGALILDIRMPGMSGLELQTQLRKRNKFIPTIFLTGHGDVSMAVKAMKEGAVDFFEKPFANEQLLESVRRCFVMEKEHDQEEARDKEAQQLIRQLTPRECEVMEGLVAGHTNKEIAKLLAISPRTVEVHRSNIMGKLGVGNLTGLVRLALRISPELR